MIRRASTEDIPQIVAWGKDFHAYGPWRHVPFDAEALTAFIAGVIEKGVVFLSDTGMIGGVLSPVYFNPAYVLAVEFFWWAPKGGGTPLREAFEAWAKEEGAHEVQFAALADDNRERVERIYARAGYSPREIAFSKRLD